MSVRIYILIYNHSFISFQNENANLEESLTKIKAELETSRTHIASPDDNFDALSEKLNEANKKIVEKEQKMLELKTQVIIFNIN